jgi:hypothetical protein
MKLSESRNPWLAAHNRPDRESRDNISRAQRLVITLMLKVQYIPAILGYGSAWHGIEVAVQVPDQKTICQHRLHIVGCNIDPRSMVVDPPRVVHDRGLVTAYPTG